MLWWSPIPERETQTPWVRGHLQKERGQESPRVQVVSPLKNLASVSDWSLCWQRSYKPGERDSELSEELHNKLDDKSEKKK